jgi:hypothetical protein
LNARGYLRISPQHIPFLVAALRRVGFADPIFQEWGIGQRFGVARPVTNLLEWHVRGFADGSLDSEVEISRKRLQHLASKPGPYYSHLLRILRSNRIPFWVGSSIPSDATQIYLPDTFGRVTPVQVPRRI